MITADTITDDQIRELRMQTGWDGPDSDRIQATITRALSKPGWMLFDANKRDAARARCAEILNARGGK